MGKRSQKRRLRSRKDQGGCMGGLISIFDFRHARFTRNLLLDRKHASSHPDESVASRYPPCKSEMLANSDKTRQTTKDLEEMGVEKYGALRTSVKELMEDAMSGEHTVNVDMGNSDRHLDQLNSENGRHVRGKPKKVKNHRSKSCDIEHMNDWAIAENFSDQVLDRETSNNLDMGIILEEFCRLNQKGSYLKQDVKDAVNMKSHQVKSLAEEKLSAAIEVFISQRFGADKHLIEDHTQYSKELMDALQTLSLNKELLFELLQDPNSLLVKQIQNMEDEQFNKDHNSRLYSNQLEEEPSKSTSGHKHRRIFRRRSKSQDGNFLKDYENSQSSSRIVILKPGPTCSRISETDRTVSTSLQNIDFKSHSERNYSHFSLNEIKRKLKHAMGKERHGLSLNDEFSRQSPNLRNIEKGLGEGNNGWSSPNRDHFYTERFTKSPFTTKKVDKLENPKESETSMESETTKSTSQGASNIYFEAKKHLSEMLSNGDEKEELVERQLPKSLGRILSLPEYSFTPIGSPRKEREHSIVVPQMKLSPGNSFHMVNENTWRLIQENHVIQLSSPKQNFGRPSFIADDEANEKPQSPKSNVHGLRDADPGNLSQDSASCINEKMNCEELLESGRLSNTCVQECIQIAAANVELSSFLSNREFGSCDTAKVIDDEKNPTSDMSGGDVSSSSPPRSPPSPLVSGRFETPGNCIDRDERPSPISVLEPMFSEDDISPSNTKLIPVTATAQPLKIHYEGYVSSDHDHTICTRPCMNDEESAFEYVEAVLLGSDLNWDEYLLRWLSSDQVLDLSLYDDVELFSSQSSHDQKLLFDCTDSVLKELCERYFAHTSVKQNFRMIPRGMELINEVWKGVERHITQSPACSLDQLLRRDMSEPGTWMDLRVETENIAIEMENSILEELVEDMILSLNNSVKDVGCETYQDEEISIN